MFVIKHEPGSLKLPHFSVLVEATRGPDQGAVDQGHGHGIGGQGREIGDLDLVDVGQGAGIERRVEKIVVAGRETYFACV